MCIRDSPSSKTRHDVRSKLERIQSPSATAAVGTMPNLGGGRWGSLALQPLLECFERSRTPSQEKQYPPLERTQRRETSSPSPLSRLDLSSRTSRRLDTCSTREIRKLEERRERQKDSPQGVPPCEGHVRARPGHVAVPRPVAQRSARGRPGQHKGATFSTFKALRISRVSVAPISGVHQSSVRLGPR